jgi:AcrR family transcriptional regulator
VPSPRRVTREAILEEATRLVERSGVNALTFQALADALEVSKQAVLYWYPSKWELMTDYSVPEMRKEADVVLAAISGSQTAADAIGRFVRAFVHHYAQRLPQFRILYLVPPVGGGPSTPDQQAALAPVHRITSSIYGALESAIAADPDFVREADPRRLAVAVHMSALGLVTMLALADSISDPLRHQMDDLIDAMVALQTGVKGGREQRAKVGGPPSERTGPKGEPR